MDRVIKKFMGPRMVDYEPQTCLHIGFEEELLFGPTTGKPVHNGAPSMLHSLGVAIILERTVLLDRFRPCS